MGTEIETIQIDTKYGLGDKVWYWKKSSGKIASGFVQEVHIIEKSIGTFVKYRLCDKNGVEIKDILFHEELLFPTKEEAFEISCLPKREQILYYIGKLLSRNKTQNHLMDGR